MATLPTYFAALLTHLVLFLSVTDIPLVFAFRTPILTASRRPAHNFFLTGRKMNSDEAANSNPQQKAPMYITIGPQCSGKTTLLQTIQHKQKNTIIHDVTIDDQRDVYVEVPTRLFLVNHVSELGQNQSDSDFRLLNQSIQHKTLSQRIYGESNDEMRAVLQRFHGTLTKGEFEKRIIQLYSPTPDSNESKQPQRQQPQSQVEVNSTPQNSSTTIPIDSNSTAVNPGHMSHAILKEHERQKRNEDILKTGQTLVQAAEALLEKNNGSVDGRLPDTVQLFVLENIFRPHPVTKQSAVDSAHAQLQHFAANSTQDAVAWGNTNTRPREYKEALEIAARNQRPVYFLLYADQKALNVDNGIFMPYTSLYELVRRNILRLLQTGKYVPAQAIFDASSRVDNLAKMAQDQLQRQVQQQAEKQQQQQQGEMDISCNENVKTDEDETRAVSNEEQSTVVTSFTKFDLDVTLCKFANYEMNTNRTITKLAQPFHQQRKEQRDRDRNQSRGRGRASNDSRNYSNNGREGQSSYQQSSDRRAYNKNSNNSKNRGYNIEGNRGGDGSRRYNENYHPRQQQPHPDRAGGWRQDQPLEYHDRHSKRGGHGGEGASRNRGPPRGEYKASNPRGGWTQNNRGHDRNQNNTTTKRFQNNNNNNNNNNNSGKHSAQRQSDNYYTPPAKRPSPPRQSNNSSRYHDRW